MNIYIYVLYKLAQLSECNLIILVCSDPYFNRHPVPVLEHKTKTKGVSASSPLLPNSTNQPMNDTGQVAHSDLASERSSYSHGSASSHKFHHIEDEDPLLKTIKAQHSLSRQMTDETSEASALLTPNMDKVGGVSSLQNHSASEAEF